MCQFQDLTLLFEVNIPLQRNVNMYIAQTQQLAIEQSDNKNWNS